MKQSDLLLPVIDSIQPYDPIDLLAKVGALLLCPENANHVIRLEALAHAASCLGFEENKPIITKHRLNLIVNEYPLGKSEIKSQEDPTPNPFTESFTFFHGPYIVFPGIVKEATFTLKHLCAAIFFGEKFNSLIAFRDEIYRMCKGILTLSNELANRAGFTRNMPAKSDSSKVYFPNNLELFKDTVIFSKEELDYLLFSAGLKTTALKEFIQPFGDIAIEDYSFENCPLHAYPISQIHNFFIVVNPLSLLSGLQFQILKTAKKFDTLNALFDEYQTRMIGTVGVSLDRFGHDSIHQEFDRKDNNIQTSLWNLDLDKALLSVLIFDDFTNFIGDQVYEKSSTNFLNDEIDQYLLKLEKKIFNESENLEGVFFLVLMAGIGRYQKIGINGLKFKQSTTFLLLNVPELEIISWLHGSNELLLYKYALAYQKFRNSSKFLSSSPLEEFEAYRRNNYSYYFHDKHRPNALITNLDGGYSLRLEALQKYDNHAVPSSQINKWVNVVNIHSEPTCPIFTPDIFQENQIQLFVELTPISFWIKSEQTTENSVETRTINPALFVDLFAYWIWQFGEILSLCLKDVVVIWPYIIHVEIASFGKYNDAHDEPLKNLPVQVCIKSENELLVKIDNNIATFLRSSTNYNELIIVKKVLEGFRDLLIHTGWEIEANQLNLTIPEFINNQMKNPYKMKLLALDVKSNPALEEGNVFSYRCVQEADINTLLDEMGNHLQYDLNIKQGKISRYRNNEILNSIVSFYFKKFTGIMNNLASDHLLEFLVLHYEEIIKERIFRKITIPTQLACFSTVEEITQQLVKELPEIDDAAMACRFLIEYAVASPPNGKKRISFEIYDYLMALASQIISRGNQSDLNQYHLFDMDLELLESGRLGFNRQLFNEKANSFQRSRSGELINASYENFSAWWREVEQINPEDFSPSEKLFNMVFEAEFGLPISDLTKFISSLYEIGDRSNHSLFKQIELTELINYASSFLNWREERVLTVIDFISLSARDSFLSPHKPYSRKDVYPWRTKRKLSYLRKPLLKVQHKEKTWICWGNRHLSDALTHILNSTLAGGFQEEYKSKEMQQFLGAQRKKEGQEFNLQVFNSINRQNGVICKKEVKKIGKKRIGYPENDLGDIDVLVIYPKARKITLIECKNLQVAKNAVEMSRELEELFSDDEKYESTVVKHMRRTNWVKNNLDYILGYFEIKKHGKWKVEPILVVKSEMITPHFYKSKIPVYSYHGFLNVYLQKN